MISRTAIRFLITAWLSLICTSARAAEPIATLRVYWNAPTRPDPRIIEKTLRASFAEAVKKHLNVDTSVPVVDLSVRFNGTDIELVISKAGAPELRADAIISMIRQHFIEIASNFFVDLSNDYMRRAADEELKEREQMRQRSEEARAELAKIRRNLRDITGRVNVSPDSLRSVITRLEDERDRLALDFEAQRVRRNAIEQAIAETSKKAQAQLNDDRIAAELIKLVTRRENDLKRIQQLRAENAVAQAEVDAAEAQIAEARVRLWERQEALNRTSGGDLLADLNRELATLSINIAETEVRLPHLKHAIERFGKATDLMDVLESAQAAKAAADAALIESEARLAERLRTLRQHQPPVVVLIPHP